MTLLRTQIREAMLTRLSQLTDYRVVDNLLYPLALEELPALTVLLEKEVRLPDYSTVLSNGACVHTYELPAVIEGRVQATQNLQRCCENMAVLAMGVMDKDLTLGGLCKTLNWEGVEIQTSTEGERPIGKLRLTATLIYRVADNAPNKAHD
jgi:hypothetical protein